MASIWVIEDGEYSDYRVEGVYSSKENAELASQNGVKGEISEWPLDPSVAHWNKGEKLIVVTMNESGDSFIEDTRWSTDGVTGPFRIGQYHEKFPSQLIIRVGSWVKSENQAVKIANEKRAQIIAAGDWKEPVR